MSINSYLLEEQSCQISYRSGLKQRSICFFEDGHPNKKQEEEEQEQQDEQRYEISS